MSVTHHRQNPLGCISNPANVTSLNNFTVTYVTSPVSGLLCKHVEAFCTFVLPVETILLISELEGYKAVYKQFIRDPVVLS
jgi:hypothetical protein